MKKMISIQKGQNGKNKAHSLLTAKAKKRLVFQANKNQVVLDNNIKECGVYSVPIKLYPEIAATINVKVGAN